MSGRAPAIEAVVFDTYGTVCDFFRPMRSAIEGYARSRGVDCDPAQLAIEWRTAYLLTTYRQATTESEFIPLQQINRANLVEVLGRHLDIEPTAAEIYDAVIPRHVEYQVWHALLESAAAEHAARMTAMENASKNAPNITDTTRFAVTFKRYSSCTLRESVAFSWSVSRWNNDMVW